ncbi:hypothetical protein EIH07_08095 [Chryseobacterium taklimakanense]|nr:hypothetical protein EIH07_08095 [Chryseobacterium taklimakanense]
MNRASCEVNGFAELLQRFERNISILGKSKRTFDNYSRHVAALALHFGKVPTELDPEDIKDYLFELQKRSKTLQPAKPRRNHFQRPPNATKKSSPSEKTALCI